MEKSTDNIPVTKTRKDDHIRINLEEDVMFKRRTSGFERVALTHNAVPELNLAEIDSTQTCLGKWMRLPILISSMTGGTAVAEKFNRIFAQAAQETGIAMGLGSQRAAIEDETLIATYQVRDIAPDILLFANLGAVQLNYGYGLDECRRAVDMVDADALILHFNPLQEAVQPEGDTNFSGLLAKVEAVCRGLSVPVIAKEVGWGISGETAVRLKNAGVSAIDVAGAGGTSWSQVEMYRAPTARLARVAGAFVDWGMETAVSIQQCHHAVPDMPLIASGGIQNGIDIAKAIALGAKAGGLAGDFLHAADSGGVEAVIERIETLGDELRIAMFVNGAKNLNALQADKYGSLGTRGVDKTL